MPTPSHMMCSKRQHFFREARAVHFWAKTNVFVVVVVVAVPIYLFNWKQQNLHYKNDI